MQLDHNAFMASDLPLTARQLELSAITQVIESAANRRGKGVLITGEAGIGKTRLLREARAVAEQHGLMVLSGRAVESGGAYRPLVEAFARPSAPFAAHRDLAGVRPTLARVLPGWVAHGAVLAPMADPAAVLASALVLLLETVAPNGAALVLDDLHWADPDTLSVLTSVIEFVDTLPLALIFAARGEKPMPATLQQLVADHSIRVLPLRRLTPTEVTDALRNSQLPQLPPDKLGQVVTAVDGLPLVMDEFVRQIEEGTSNAGQLNLEAITLTSAVQLRLVGLSADCRSVLDALSVIGDTDAEVLMAATALDADRLGAALHVGLDSTLLAAASNSLGVRWRHILLGEAVRNLLLPLERQAIAGRAADQLSSGTARTDGQLRQAARLYEIAGRPNQAAQLLINAARLAVTHAALDVAQQYLADAQALTGDLPKGAHDVLIQRIETLTVAGRAGEAYQSGVAALTRMETPDNHRLLVVTARAAYAAGVYQEGPDLLARLESESESPGAQIAVLRALAAYADRRAPEAVELGRHAALRAQQEGHLDLACEALVIAGMAARRIDTGQSGSILAEAIELSQRHELPVWEVRAKAELGVIDMITNSDPTRLEQARKLATTAGMVGEVAQIDLHIGQTELTRKGFLADYPTMAGVDRQARQLHLTGLHAQAYNHLVECYLLADQPLPGTTQPPEAADIKAMVAQGIELAAKVGRVSPRSTLGVRAWLQGDSPTAIRMIEEDLQSAQEQFKVSPWWGLAKLLRTIDGADPSEAFDPVDLTGHHVNWAARAFGFAIWRLRTGQPADAALGQAEHFLRNTPFWGHLLRTVAAPAAFQTGMDAAGGWLREADAFFGAAGERLLQRRVRYSLAAIGGKVPRTSASVPVHLARFGITARETEILRLVNAGLSNTEIAQQLFISIRTVETHVSSMLQKTGAERREQLPSTVK